MVVNSPGTLRITSCPALKTLISTIDGCLVDLPSLLLLLDDAFDDSVTDGADEANYRNAVIQGESVS